MRGVFLGLVAGAVGTGALSLFELLEAELASQMPVYASSSIGRALLRGRGSEASARTLGLALRWSYGPLLGVMVAFARRRLPASTLGAGLIAALAVAVSELALLPRVGAVPPWRYWPVGQRLTFGPHVVTWGLATALVYDSATRSAVNSDQDPKSRQIPQMHDRLRTG